MSIKYTVKKSDRARAMRVSVYPDGAVVVTTPRWGTKSGILRFVAKYWAWIERQVALTHGRSVIRVSRGEIPALKKRALQLAEERCMHFAAFYGISYGTISVRAQKTRWGSCSKEGNLSFNYKIAALPEKIADYVIVHELCHRIAFDHSKKFWAEVERAVPDHKALRKELRSLSFSFR